MSAIQRSQGSTPFQWVSFFGTLLKYILHMKLYIRGMQRRQKREFCQNRNDWQLSEFPSTQTSCYCQTFQDSAVDVESLAFRRKRKNRSHPSRTCHIRHGKRLAAATSLATVATAWQQRSGPGGAVVMYLPPLQ